MATLIRCDKCGCVRQPQATRPITVCFCDPKGMCDGWGKIHWANKDIRKVIQVDLCENCWVKFVDDTHDYFELKQ